MVLLCWLLAKDRVKRTKRSKKKAVITQDCGDFGDPVKALLEPCLTPRNSWGCSRLQPISQWVDPTLPSLPIPISWGWMMEEATFFFFDFLLGSAPDQRIRSLVVSESPNAPSVGLIYYVCTRYVEVCVGGRQTKYNSPGIGFVIRLQFDSAGSAI